MKRERVTEPPRVLPLLLVGLTGIWVALAAVGLLYFGAEAVHDDDRGWHAPSLAEAVGVLQMAVLLVAVSLANRWVARWWTRNHAPPRAD